MCLQFYAPRKDMIKDEWIVNSFTSNPDGAGIAWRQDGILHFKKGLMTLAEVRRAINLIPDDSPVLAHFRFATAGGVSREMTHPFTPSDTLTGSGEAVFMQNGVVSGSIIQNVLDLWDEGTPEQKKEIRQRFYNNTVSDTWAIFQPLWQMPREIACDILNQLTKMNWSRWIIWYPDEETPRLIAKDNVESDGCSFSNSAALRDSFDYRAYLGSYSKKKSKKVASLFGDDDF